MTTAATRKSSGVLSAGIMTGIAYVALPIPRFVRVKVVERLFPATRQRAMIAITRIEAVIDVTIEATRTVEPGPGSYEDAASEPIRTVVAVGSAVIRGIVKVSVGANRGYTDINRNLSRCFRAGGEQKSSSKKEQTEKFGNAHLSPRIGGYSIISSLRLFRWPYLFPGSFAWKQILSITA